MPVAEERLLPFFHATNSNAKEEKKKEKEYQLSLISTNSKSITTGRAGSLRKAPKRGPWVNSRSLGCYCLHG